MRILHLTPYYAPAYAYGGVVRAVEGMALALARRRHDITILTTDALDQSHAYDGPRDERLDGVRVLRCPNASTWLRGKLNLSTPRGMRSLARDILPDTDILHLHEFRTAENLLLTPLAHELGKPIALSPHGTLDLTTGRGGLKRLWDRCLSPTVARRINEVICLTDHEHAEARQLWQDFCGAQSPTRFSVIPNGVDVAAFDALPSALEFRRRHRLDDSPIALFLGRLHARKGPDLLLRAFQRAGVADARLVFAGADDGMLSTLRTLAAGDERIVFAGYLDGDERLAALAAADVFSLPAVGEGLPMAALEAMAARLPVLLSPGCHLPAVDAAGAGFVAEASVDAFADKLRLLLTDSNGREKMGEAARRYVTAQHSWQAVAGQMEAVYARLLAGG